MRVCKSCYCPDEESEFCSACSSELFINYTTPYTIKQWEQWVDSLKGGCAHDFEPFEFNEDGGVNRSCGISMYEECVSPCGETGLSGASGSTYDSTVHSQQKSVFGKGWMGKSKRK